VFGVDGSYSISADEAHANARLIAAAPDLAAALRDLVSVIESLRQCNDWSSEPTGVMDRARAALSKVDGR
jgi:hypothetical protein